MSAPQGLVEYPGLVDFTSCTYTLSTGISPGKIVIEMPAAQELLDGIEAFGDVTFSYEDVEITLSNCVLKSANIEQGATGYIGRVTLHDRRDLWSNLQGGGAVSGHYNMRMPSGTNADEGFNSQAAQSQGDSTKIRQGTEKAPQDMAIACLTAMGEEDYDVSALPNDARPEVDWSYTNAAEALQHLCEELGCRVTYNVDQDSVVIVTIGQGNDLPDNGQQQFVSIGVSAPVLPSSLLCVGGPTIFQGIIGLDAVGIDTDGSIQLIDNLSYIPTTANGWADVEPYTWAYFTNLQTRTLVERSIYRMWRIQVPYAPTTDLVQLLDANEQQYQPDSIQEVHLYDRLIETHFDPSDPAKIIPKKPVIYGQFESGLSQVIKTSALQQQGQNVSPNQYVDGLSVDADRWLIITEDQLLYKDASGYHPAKIGVKIAYSLRDPNNWEFIRYTQEQQLDSDADTESRIVRREEIFAKVIGSYDTTAPWNYQSATDNMGADQIQNECNYWLQAAMQEYIEQDTLDVPYVGIVDIQVDGLIHQVTWSIKAGEHGSTTTRASLATEHDPYTLPWGARREAERKRELASRDKDLPFMRGVGATRGNGF